MDANFLLKLIKCQHGPSVTPLRRGSVTESWFEIVTTALNGTAVINCTIRKVYVTSYQEY